MAYSLYVTPTDVQQLLPLGVQWGTLGGKNVTADLNAVAILEACRTATRQVNGETGQSLQSVVRTEAALAPSYRVGILNRGCGPARFLASMSPVSKVLLVQVAYGGQPRVVTPGGPATFNFTPVPPGFAYPDYTSSDDNWDIDLPGSAAPGSNAILIGGGYVNWWNGRQGQWVQVSYYNGWPNSALSASAAAGDTVLQVNDVSGWGNNAGNTGGEVYDGMATEGVVVLSVSGTTNTDAVTGVPVGPGTLHLRDPLVNAHTPTSFSPILVSAMPHPVRWATGLFAKAVALRQGATVVTGPAGKTTSQTGSVGAIEEALHEAALVLGPYRRTSF